MPTFKQTHPNARVMYTTLQHLKNTLHTGVSNATTSHITKRLLSFAKTLTTTAHAQQTLSHKTPGNFQEARVRDIDNKHITISRPSAKRERKKNKAYTQRNGLYGIKSFYLPLFILQKIFAEEANDDPIRRFSRYRKLAVYGREGKAYII